MPPRRQRHCVPALKSRLAPCGSRPPRSEEGRPPPLPHPPLLLLLPGGPRGLHLRNLKKRKKFDLLVARELYICATISALTR